MKITITNDGIKVTDALKQHILDKFEHLTRIFNKSPSIHVTLSLENLEQVAKALVHAHGTEFYAHAKSKDLYQSVDELIASIKSQVNKHKQKEKEKRHDSSEKFNDDYTDEE